jgi:hypothetical protein
LHELEGQDVISDYDRAHIGELVGGQGDWFTARLMHLIGHADLRNRARIRIAFPEEMAAFDEWYNATRDEKGSTIEELLGDEE